MAANYCYDARMKGCVCCEERYGSGLSTDEWGGEWGGPPRAPERPAPASGERCLFLNAWSAAIAGRIAFLWLGRR